MRELVNRIQDDLNRLEARITERERRERETAMDTEKQVEYLKNQEACALRKGDFVRVVSRAKDYEGGWKCQWPDHPDCLIVGRTFKIWRLDGQGVHLCYDRLTDEELVLPYFVLKRIELPEYEFKPFERVLVRDYEEDAWMPSLFSYMDGEDYRCVDGCSWTYVIPYEGHELWAGQVCDLDGAPLSFAEGDSGSGDF